MSINNEKPSKKVANLSDFCFHGFSKDCPACKANNEKKGWDWREEFDKLFSYASFCWNIDNSIGKSLAIKQRKTVKKFISQVEASAYERGREDSIKDCKGVINDFWASKPDFTLDLSQELLSILNDMK